MVSIVDNPTPSVLVQLITSFYPSCFQGVCSYSFLFLLAAAICSGHYSLFARTTTIIPWVFLLLISSPSSLIFFIFIFYKFIYLFTYLSLHWVFVAACRLSLVLASRGYSSLWCMGFSLQWLLLLWSMGSRLTGLLLLLQSTGAGHEGFSSCGTRAQ